MSAKKDSLLYCVAFSIVATLFYLAAYLSMRRGIVWPANRHVDPSQLMRTTNPKQFFNAVALFLVLGTTFLGGAVAFARMIFKKHDDA